MFMVAAIAASVRFRKCDDKPDGSGLSRSYVGVGLRLGLSYVRTVGLGLGFRARVRVVTITCYRATVMVTVSDDSG
jgi:hypothetical protein